MTDLEMVASSDAFAPVVTALGSPTFASALIAALNQIVRVDHVCLMRFDGGLRAPVLESASWRGGEHVAQVQRAYLDGYYRSDPNLHLAGSALLRDGIGVVRLNRDDVHDAAYRMDCYTRPGVCERLTVASFGDGRLYCLNLYRREESGCFGACEINAVEGLSRLLAALATKHAGTVGMLLRSRDRGDRIAALTARLHALHGGLTRRELDVLARALLGMTSEGIALDLGIRVNSVLTYRKRAYGRLKVTGQAELFSLCLG